MRKKYAELQYIDDQGEVGEAESAFLRSLENGLLLALMELGYLNEAQYRYAAEQLRKA